MNSKSFLLVLVLAMTFILPAMCQSLTNNLALVPSLGVGTHSVPTTGLDTPWLHTAPFVAARTNFNILTTVQASPKNGSSVSFLRPGIYRTTPFFAIVVVPNEDLDSKMVVRPSDTDGRMPILKPELHFIPFRSK